MKIMLLVVGILFAGVGMAATQLPSPFASVSRCVALKNASDSYDITGSFKGNKIAGVVIFATPSDPPSAVYLKGNVTISDAQGKVVDSGSLDDFKSICRAGSGSIFHSISLVWRDNSIFAEGLGSSHCYTGRISDKFASLTGVIHFCLNPHK